MCLGEQGVCLAGTETQGESSGGTAWTQQLDSNLEDLNGRLWNVAILSRQRKPTKKHEQGIDVIRAALCQDSSNHSVQDGGEEMAGPETNETAIAWIDLVISIPS